MKWKYLCPECMIRMYKTILDAPKKKVSKRVGHCSECYQMTRIKVDIDDKS